MPWINRAVPIFLLSQLALSGVQVPDRERVSVDCHKDEWVVAVCLRGPWPGAHRDHRRWPGHQQEKRGRPGKLKTALEAKDFQCRQKS